MRKKLSLKYYGAKPTTMERSLLLFQNSLKSEKSFKTYYKNLDFFRRFVGSEDFDSITRINPEKLQVCLEDYIMDLKNRISPNTIPTYYFPIQTFLETNDIDLKWRKVRRLFPAKVKRTGREAWSTEDIKLMLSVTPNIRNKSLILFLASSGIRIGAIEGLKIGNMIDMPLGCKAVLVYEDSTEEHWTFITTEASEMLDKYLKKRRDDGEVITSSSPIFRTRYAKRTTKVKGLSTRGASQVIIRAIKSSGLRTHEEKKRGRFNKMPDHAFRKRFLTILKSNPKIPTSQAEKMVGHQVYRDEGNNMVMLDSSYNVPTAETLFNSYKHAITDLTVDDYTKVKIKESQIEKQYTALQQEKQKHFEEKKKWYKTILNRAKTEGEIPDWLRPVMDEMIQDFES
jgi:integrase/recombinase XerD